MLIITKVARIGLLLGVMLSLSATYAFAAPILSIEPSSQQVQSGQSFSLDVLISNVADLYAFQFDLAFNPLVLSATGVAEGSFLPSGGTTAFIAGTIDNSAGTISGIADSLIGPIPGVSGTGSLAIIDVHALSPGTSPIILSNVVLLDSSLTPIGSNVVNGIVDVVPEPSTLLLLATSCVGLLALGAGAAQQRRPALGEWPCFLNLCNIKRNGTRTHL
jgi:hypothetical protein